MALALLAAVAVFAYMWAPKQAKQDVNRVLSNAGVTITPWIDRAEAALRAQLAKPDQQQVMAKTILAATHETGREPSLTRWTVSKEGQTLVATFDVAWKGGILGGRYTTSVTWRCNKQGHIDAVVTADNAAVKSGPEEAKRLDDWFRTEAYRVLYSNAGGD